MNVPDQSRPAASFAADTRPSAFCGAGVCSVVIAPLDTTAAAVATTIARRFMANDTAVRCPQAVCTKKKGGELSLAALRSFRPAEAGRYRHYSPRSPVLGASAS